MSRNKNVRIAFWSKSTGNLMTSGKGLSVEEVEFLKNLKPGDRLIVWDNSTKNAGTNNPTHNLTVYQPNEKSKEDDEKSSKSKRSILA